MPIIKSSQPILDTGAGTTKPVTGKASKSGTAEKGSARKKIHIILEPEISVQPTRPQPEDWDVPGTHYNCFNCLAMCCSVYERVAVNEDDIARLAEHFQVSRRAFLRTYTHRNGDEICLNRVEDEVLEETCVFLNQETRLCGVHQVRPLVCRVWPPPQTEGRCVYYDVLQFERSFQGDPGVVIKVEVNVSVDEDE